MKIEVFETIQNENIDVVRFAIDGIPLELANAFRRIILSEVPSMAIDEVIFLENDSPLFDEFIAHRLGLIPLKTDLSSYNLPEDCACGGVGCTLCQVEFTCSVKGELDKTIVKSSNLVSTDPNTIPTSENIIIAKLQKGSSLEFEAYARLGIGAEHAKWQPVSTVGFGYFPDVKIDSTKCKDCPNQCIAKDRCPVNVIEFEKDKASLTKEYWQECTICESCQKYCPQDAITVDYVPNKYVFAVEGTGAIPIKDILLKACDIFTEKINEFDSNIKNKELFNV